MQVSAEVRKALDFCVLSRVVGTCCFIVILYLNTVMRLLHGHCTAQRMGVGGTGLPTTAAKCQDW